MFRKPLNFNPTIKKLASNSTKRKASKTKPIKVKVPTIKSKATGGPIGGGGRAITNYFKIITPNHKIESEFSAKNPVKIKGAEDGNCYK